MVSNVIKFYHFESLLDEILFLENKIKIFYREHIHYDEEIRFTIDGCGYFDVRGFNDEWIRIAVEGGDL